MQRVFGILATGMILLVAACPSSRPAGGFLPSMTPAELAESLRSKAPAVPVCTDSELECRDERIPGALCLPCDGKPEKAREAVRGKDVPLILYGRRARSAEDCPLVEEVRRIGAQKIYALSGGLAGWKARGYATESPERIPRLPVPSVRPAEVDAWLTSRKLVLLLDIRIPARFDRERVPGSLNIPLSRLPELYQTLPLNRPVLVIDEDGGRALLAASYLKGKGFEDVMRLYGGMESWRSYEERRR